jgi:hypothetical protein
VGVFCQKEEMIVMAYGLQILARIKAWMPLA